MDHPRLLFTVGILLIAGVIAVGAFAFSRGDATSQNTPGMTGTTPMMGSTTP
jgi:hypothetical protein